MTIVHNILISNKILQVYIKSQMEQSEQNLLIRRYQSNRLGEELKHSYLPFYKTFSLDWSSTTHYIQTKYPSMRNVGSVCSRTKIRSLFALQRTYFPINILFITQFVVV